MRLLRGRDPALVLAMAAVASGLLAGLMHLLGAEAEGFVARAAVAGFYLLIAAAVLIASYGLFVHGCRYRTSEQPRGFGTPR